jgi:uncharacterized membrane protein YphA (DoxX/SURF4 family)
MSDTAGAFLLAGRIIFGAFFGLFAGIGGHLTKSKMMEEYARSMRFPVPDIAGWPTGVWLVLGSLSIALGIWPDIGALMIAAFVVPAAAYFHRFWEVEDPMQVMMQQGFFFRNGIALAACLFMFGTFAGLGDQVPFTITDPAFDF